jgi:Haem-degrading
MQSGTLARHIVLEGSPMKLHAGFLAVAVLVLAGGALAADGDQFVIQGDASKVLDEQHEINVATAEAIGRACVEEAVKQGVRVSVGQGKIAIETAIMKAKTVLNTRLPSKRTMNDVLSGRSSELRQYSHGNFAQGGGLPIIINGSQFIGAIGVGGSAGNLPVWSDEICAWRALTKVIGPQPALLPDIAPGGTTERVRRQ